MKRSEQHQKPEGEGHRDVDAEEGHEHEGRHHRAQERAERGQEEHQPRRARQVGAGGAISDQRDGLAQEVDRVDQEQRGMNGSLDQAMRETKTVEDLEEGGQKGMRQPEAENEGGNQQVPSELPAHACLIAGGEARPTARLVAEGQGQQNRGNHDGHRVGGVAHVRGELTDGEELHRQNSVALDGNRTEQ